MRKALCGKWPKGCWMLGLREMLAGAWPGSKILASSGHFAGAAGFASKSGFTEDDACVTCRPVRARTTADENGSGRL